MHGGLSVCWVVWVVDNWAVDWGLIIIRRSSTCLSQQLLLFQLLSRGARPSALQIQLNTMLVRLKEAQASRFAQVGALLCWLIKGCPPAA